MKRTIGLALILLAGSPAPAQHRPILPGTTPLEMEGDLSLQVIDQVDRFLLEMIERSPEEREAKWSRDFSSVEAYQRSLEAPRRRFAHSIGLADQRLAPGDLELVARLGSPALVAETPSFKVFAVRWKVLPGVDAQGLLLEPTEKALAQVVALPEADWTPETIVGLDSGIPGKPPYARFLAEVGCRVLVPTLIDRGFQWSGNPLVRLSPFRRKAYWRDADKSSLEAWQQSTVAYRDTFWKEVIGWLPPAGLPPNPRTRLIYETPRWQGFEVILDVWPGVETYGILVLPHDLQPGERRPVVVAQHGADGRPQDVCDPRQDTPAYHSFGARLADRRFIVYAPQNLHTGYPEVEFLQRKAFALKLTFFAPMVRLHEQVLLWLSSLDFVDPERIAFYGLSYGGKSAMLIPAVLKNYALSICSGDFNEEVWKHASTYYSYSFMFNTGGGFDHIEFDFGGRFNYAELAGLIAPRPFMVERGHWDGVAPDEWVAYEYAKVRRLYVELGIPERTGIEFFDGGHEIHLHGTLEFLQRHLKWVGSTP